MIVREISLQDVDISEFNTRKNLADGQYDSTIEDLAKSIEKQGLLSPITVFQKPDGRYALVAGQRRLLACKQLGWSMIPAIVRDSMTDADATAISLVENVHRADMNPRDKAVAFKALLDRFGNFQTVSRETGVSVSTIRKYVQLLDLAPQLQEQLVAGEARNTEALARLAQRFDADKQVEVWNKIRGFTQDVQQEIIKRADPGLENLDTLVDQAAEGAFNYYVVRNCPFDCPTIPESLKKQVAEMVEAFKAKGVKQEVQKQLRKTSGKRSAN
jgi:ParB/RepB/Spo0J family partition protein